MIEGGSFRRHRNAAGQGGCGELSGDCSGWKARRQRRTAGEVAMRAAPLDRLARRSMAAHDESVHPRTPAAPCPQLFFCSSARSLLILLCRSRSSRVCSLVRSLARSLSSSLSNAAYLKNIRYSRGFFHGRNR
eukprot:scaffold120805_cov32-Tisochrysis_lutea.AAC.3